jgi:hypothetical protein
MLLVRVQMFVLGIALAGCLAAPPPATGDGPGGDGGPGAGDDDDDDPDAGGGGADACVTGTSLDLAWVREVAFDFEAQSQVTIRGLAVIVNPGPDAIDVGTLSVGPVAGDGPVEAAFQLSGVDLTIAPGQAMGALNTGAAPTVLPVVTEEWVDLASPELSAVLLFDGSIGEADLPVRLEIGGYQFDIGLRVFHDPGFTTIGWARAPERITAFCE